MPPTFIYFLGFIVYIFLSGVTLVIFGPMLFIKKKKILAKKTLALVLSSFPSLLLMSFFWTIILGLPGLLLIWIVGESSFAPFILLPAILVYSLLIATSSLYLWYLVTKILLCQIEGNSIVDLLNQESFYQTVKSNILMFKKKFIKDKQNTQ